MECMNRAKNKENCPCDELDCPRRGICCECIAFHRNSFSKTACME